MEVIGRHKEVKILKELLSRKDSQFVAVYGRRRVGKTYLIRKTYKSQIKFECTAMHGVSRKEQLLHFWTELQKVFKSSHLPPSAWGEAFEYLGEYIDKAKSGRGGKKVVFLDEISWYDTARSGFLPAFTHFWNSYCEKRSDVLLIICGSAASWIIDKVVNDRGGLHNRLTRTLRLLPFDIKEMSQLLKSNKVKLSKKDIIQLYMITGGIPYYLNHVLPGKGIAEILDDLFFGQHPALASEFDNLYAALFKNHEKHLAVVKALSKKGKGLTREEILRSTKFKSGGWFTKILDELIQCGFIMESQDMDKASEDGLFRLVDEFTLFYYKFLERKKSSLTGASLANSHGFKVWSGFAFENLCIKHHGLIAEALGISGVDYEVYSFVDKGAAESTGSQIDMVIDRADDYLHVIEAKFHSIPFKITKSVAANLANKVNSLRRKTETRKTIFTTMVTIRGVEKNTHYHEVVTNDIQLEDYI